jgi:hypothetical protein
MKKITNYKIQITIKKPKAVMVCIDSFKLQTMTALIKSFCGGTESVGQWVSGSVRLLGSEVMNTANLHDVQSAVQ